MLCDIFKTQFLCSISLPTYISVIHKINQSETHYFLFHTFILYRNFSLDNKPSIPVTIQQCPFPFYLSLKTISLSIDVRLSWSQIKLTNILTWNSISRSDGKEPDYSPFKITFKQRTRQIIKVNRYSNECYTLFPSL